MDEHETTSSIVTICGATRRERRWRLTDEMNITSICGVSRFDLRQAEGTGSAEVEIGIRSVLGSVELIVPEGTRVVLDGQTFVAVASSDVDDSPDSPIPTLVVTALAVFGRVRVCSPDRLTRRGRKARRDVDPKLSVPADPGSAVDPVDPAPAEAASTETVDEPVLEEPVLEEPVLEERVLEDPVLEEPVLEERVLEDPAHEEITTDGATVEDLGAEETDGVSAEDEPVEDAA